MNIKDKYKVNIIDVDNIGNGICRIDNKVVFVPYSAIGDVIDLKIIEDKRNYSIGEITDIKEIENINNKDFLEIINLKDNKINNFNELIKIIKDFPKLKFLDVSYNDIKEEDVLEMINRIKKEYKRDINILIEKNDNNID